MGHPAGPARQPARQPAELQGQEGHVLHPFLEEALPVAGDPLGALPGQVEHDGDVVGGQVPHHVDVLAHLAQVEAPGVEVEHVPEVAGVRLLLHPAQGVVVQEGVPHHQGQPPGLRQGPQLPALRAGGRQGLLHEDVLPRLQGLRRHPEVQLRRGGDHHRVDLGVAQQVLERVVQPGPGVPCPHVLQPRGVPIADRGERRPRQLRQVADQVGAPVAGPHHPRPHRALTHPRHSCDGTLFQGNHSLPSGVHASTRQGPQTQHPNALPPPRVAHRGIPPGAPHKRMFSARR